MIRRETLSKTIQWWIYCRAFEVFGNMKAWSKIGAFLWK